MPIAGVIGGKGPMNIGGGQTRGYMGVFDDVIIVVEICEFKVFDWPVNQNCAGNEQQANDGYWALFLEVHRKQQFCEICGLVQCLIGVCAFARTFNEDYE